MFKAGHNPQIGIRIRDFIDFIAFLQILCGFPLELIEQTHIFGDRGRKSSIFADKRTETIFLQFLDIIKDLIDPGNQ